MSMNSIYLIIPGIALNKVYLLETLFLIKIDISKYYSKNIIDNNIIKLYKNYLLYIFIFTISRKK